MFIEIRNPFAVELLNDRVTHFENSPEKALTRFGNGSARGRAVDGIDGDHQVAESVGEDKLRAFRRDANAGGATVQMWGSTAISTLTLPFDNRNGDSDWIIFLPREGSIMEPLVVLGKESKECGAPHRCGHAWPEHTAKPFLTPL